MARFMYQGSEPPVMSHSPVPAAFIAGMTFHITRTARAVMRAPPMVMLYQCLLHQSLAWPWSRRSGPLKSRPVKPKYRIPALSQKKMANHDKPPRLPLRKPMPSIPNRPASCQLPIVYRIQLIPIKSPSVRHCSAQQNATNMATRPVNKAQKKPTCSARKILSGLSRLVKCHRLNA